MTTRKFEAVRDKGRHGQKMLDGLIARCGGHSAVDHFNKAEDIYVDKGGYRLEDGPNCTLAFPICTQSL